MDQELNKQDESYFEKYDSSLSESLDGESNKKKKSKKPPLIVRILKWLFPWRGDRVFEVIRKCVFIAAVVAFIISANVLVGNYYDNSKSQQQTATIVELTTGKFLQPVVVKTGQKVPEQPSFSSALTKYPDFRGLLTVPGTKAIDEPIFADHLQDSTPDSFYLTHDMTLANNRYGQVFMERADNFNALKQSTNLILYGHCMRNGTRFGELGNLRSLSVYQQNPVFNFQSIYRLPTQYKIFAVFVVNVVDTDDTDNNGKPYVFNYRQTDFSSSGDFNNYVAQVKQRSIINIPVDVKYGDSIMTLSSCAYDFNSQEHCRIGVMGRRFRQGETASVNTSVATINPDPLYPDAYYKAKGIPLSEKPKMIPDYSQTKTNSNPLATY